MVSVAKHARILTLFASSLLLAGCPGTNGSLSSGVTLVGQTDILPTKTLKVGHLYFEGAGRRPAFQLADGTVYSEVCYDDFTQTKALQAIDKYITVATTVNYDQSTRTVGDTLSVNVTGIKFGIFSAGLNGSYAPNDTLVIQNAREITLSDAGMAAIKGALGAGCRKEIANKKVILIADAIRADSATLTRTATYGGGGSVSANGTIGGIALNGPGVNGTLQRQNKTETKFTLVYLSIGSNSAFTQ